MTRKLATGLLAVLILAAVATPVTLVRMNLRQIAGHGQCHRDDPTLGGRIGQLPYLSVKGCDRGGVDDYAARAVCADPGDPPQNHLKPGDRLPISIVRECAARGGSHPGGFLSTGRWWPQQRKQQQWII